MEAAVTSAAPETGESLLSAAQPQNPAPVAAPSSNPYVLGDGKFAPTWREALAPELRDNPALTTVPDLQTLAQNYVHTKGMVGRKLQAPGESATPEDVAAWRKTVGAPDTPDGYAEFLTPDDFPADQWNKEVAGEFAKSVAHKHHLPPAAVKDIMNFYGRTLKDGTAQYEAGEKASREEGLKTLQKEWGGNFDRELHAAKTMAAALGLPEVAPEFNSPEFILGMARAAKLFPRNGDTAVNGGAPSVSSGLDAQIESIKKNPEYAQATAGPERQEYWSQQLRNIFAAKQQAEKR